MTVKVSSPAVGIAVLTIDELATRNALSDSVLTALRRELLACAEAPEVRVVVITGTGRAFSAGGDTRRMGVARLTPPERKEYLERGVGRLADVLFNYDKPLIAALNGAAVGAGMDLALWCDFRFAVTSAYLRSGYIDLALPPGFGAAWLLRQLVGPTRTLDILLTGRKVGAAEAQALGLFEAVLDGPEEMMTAVLERAAVLTSKSEAAVRLTKRLVRQARYLHPGDSMDLASSHFGVLQESPDHVAAVRALQEGQ
jgi:enoyl-CoA hydratase/carnithine racemase